MTQYATRAHIAKASQTAAAVARSASLSSSERADERTTNERRWRRLAPSVALARRRTCRRVGRANVASQSAAAAANHEDSVCAEAEA